MGFHPFPDFGALLARLARVLAGHDLAFMVIGGHAVLLHGEPRLTQDIDITLHAGPERLGKVLDACAELGLTPLPADVPEFVRSTFVLPARDAQTGVRVDLIFSTTSYEARAIERAEMVLIEGERVPFATAEDLVIHKLFAARPRDIEDAVGVVRRKGRTLDWSYMRRCAEEFASVPGQEGLAAALEDLRRAVGED